MRIGIDARFYGSLGKGLGRYTEKLIEGLALLDQENEYYIFLRRENFDEFEPQNSRFHKVLADFPWYGWQEQFLFPRLLLSFSLDLVHFPHFNVPLFYRQPFVVTIHDLILLHFPTIKATELPPFLYWMKYWVYRLVIASALSRARQILTVSQFTRADIISRFPKTEPKLVVTHEAADESCVFVPKEEARAFLRSLDLLKGSQPKAYALYVGNAYPHKNLTLILTAAHAFPETVFVLVGKEDYFYRELQEKVKEQKLKNILFTSFISDRLLSVLYREARVYLFPSLYEGFGLPALEACLYGLPVLASDRGSLREVLGKAGLFFDPTKKEVFLTSLRALLSDPLQRQSLKEAGYQQANSFHWRDLARQTLQVYEQAAQR